MKSFYENIAKIEKLKDIIQPTNHDLKKLLEIMKLGNELSVYFYENCKNAAWISLLERAGKFEDLGNPENKIGPRERLKAKYLAEVAGEKSEEVLEIIGKINAKDGFVKGSFLEALLKMPVDKAVRGLSIVKKYLEGRSAKEWYFVGRGAAQLMVAFAEKYTDEAFEIAEALLEVWKPEEGEKSGFREIEAKFKAFEYKDLVFKYYNKLWERYPLRATRLLVQIFSRHLEEIQEDKDYEVSSHFYISMERLDQIERIERDITSVIVAGICEAGKAAVKKQTETDELLKLLRSINKEIFTRIEMYLLRSVPAGTQKERINEVISNKDYRNITGYKYEYYLLLNDKYDDISDDAKKDFLKWIEERQVPNEEIGRFAEWFKEINGRDYRKEDLLKYEDGLRAHKLYLVKERFREQYEKYRNSSGRNDEELAPRRMVGEVTRVSPMEGTPLTPEEMAKMKVDEVLKYILDPNNYEGKKEVSGWGTAKDALRSTFKEDVKKRTLEYLGCDIKKLASIPAEFLASFFYGVDEGAREGSFNKDGWKPSIELAALVVENNNKKEEYRNCYSAITSTLRDGFSERENKIEFDKEMVRKFWEIIEPLVHFPIEDRSGFGEERDPVQMSCNMVAGEALELTVPLGIVCKRDFKDLFETYLKEKIQKCYEYVLSKIRQSGVNCVFGLDFSRIYWIDKDWVEEKIESIFCDELWDETWGTYVSWGRPSQNGFKLLIEKGKYGRAVEQLRQANKFKFQKEPEEGLVEHLMIGFFNGWIGFEDALLRTFFDKALVKLRGHAASFLATGFAPLKEKPDKETNARLKHYWEMRLEAISKDPEANMNEAVEFLGWVKNSPLEIGETLELLYKTLELTDGQLGEGKSIYDFMEGIYDIGKGHELMALCCMNKAMNDKHMAGYFSLYEEKATKFMESIVELPDNYPNVEDIRKEAIRLADAYGRRHIYQLRPIYEQLVNKVGKDQKPEI